MSTRHHLTRAAAGLALVIATLAATAGGASAVEPIEAPARWLAELRGRFDVDGLVVLPRTDVEAQIHRLWTELVHEPALDIALARASDGHARAWLSDALLDAARHHEREARRERAG